MFEIVFITGGPSILDTNRCNSFICIAFGAFVAIQVFIILMLNVFARHANLIWALKGFFVRTIMQKSGRIALALQTFAVHGSMQENPSRSKYCELIGSKPISESRISQWGRG